ncbi:growth-regulating factor 7 [Syzygium oleosum]|uniref:growth-regulating factor 7 n=1 Tax=Syzygium oleosum TaxID=219896 RepID=UPI0011D1FDCC|nr:growth-regulating factor 7 [Syzygium oleosum]
MMVHHENHPGGGGVGGGGGGGPAGGVFPNVVLLPSDVSGGARGDNGGLGGGFVRTLQPYGMASAVHTAFKSPGAMLGYPFTHAQWKELERQAMIYKYMMASIPVPPELLIPILTPRDGPPRYSFGNGYSLRYSSNGDPEPGRCKRTDGKKWRCSREVAPDQKYCERHLHRGRPRSRKPVELHPSVSKKTRLLHQPSPLPKAEDPPLFLHKPSQSSHSLASPLKEARNTDWLMIGESSPVPMLDQQQWPSSMHSKIGSTAESSLDNFNPFLAKEEPLNLSFSTGYPSGEIHHFSKNQFFLDSYSLPLDKPQIENPKGFIDAWSNSVSAGNSSRCSVSSDEKISLSSLTLSVGGNHSIEDEMGRAHLGFSLLDSDRNRSKNNSHATSWLGSTSWVSSTPGGPLAEVLGPGINATLSNPPSPGAGNKDPGSVLTTTVSSPSGVLHRTLASLSDSSGGSSPTPSSSMARSEITVKWFNPNKLASSN